MEKSKAMTASRKSSKGVQLRWRGRSQIKQAGMLRDSCTVVLGMQFSAEEPASGEFSGEYVCGLFRNWAGGQCG